MRVSDEMPRIKGLRITKKIGDIFSMNRGEVVFQVLEVRGSHVTIAIQADRDKYPIDMYGAELTADSFVEGA